jgi:two-component system, NarL family, nitrate/nitrite response regulator NarL
MRRRPKKAVILTQVPFLAVGLGEMLRSEGFEVMLLSGDDHTTLEDVVPGEALLVIIHGESETCLELWAQLYQKSPNSIFVLWTEKITLEMALQAFEAGVRSILSTKLSPEVSLATILRICDGDECQLSITTETVCRTTKIPRLTEREKQILQLVKAAAKNKEIAHALQLTEGTVKVYVHKLLRKVSVTSRLELAQWDPAVSERAHRGWSTAASRSVASLPAITSTVPLWSAANV